MEDMILLKQGEMTLKGLNRRVFESKLIENIKRRLKPLGDFRVYASQSAVYIVPHSSKNGRDGEVTGEVSDGAGGTAHTDIDDVIEVVKTVFGIATFSKATACDKDKDVIVKTAADYLKDNIKAAKTFKVEAKRADKSFPMTSVELAQYAGGELHEMFPHLTADMHTPELVIHVEIREKAAYIHGPAQRGAGGLPVGTGGRMAALLSGGIDSPAAMYLMAKRGVRLFPIHFHSPPYTSPQAADKVKTLAKQLEKYCGKLNVIFVPFTDVQEQIRKNCPEPLMTVITRRFMVRIAERLAAYYNCNALITGDNLGQVASQTAQALAMCDNCADIPVFRPLIAYDKNEIITIARDIGTFEISTLPFEDCCTVFTPRRPRTKPRLNEVEAAEAKLDIQQLVNTAFDETIDAATRD